MTSNPDPNHFSNFPEFRQISSEANLPVRPSRLIRYKNWSDLIDQTAIDSGVPFLEKEQMLRVLEEMQSNGLIRIESLDQDTGECEIRFYTSVLNQPQN